MAVILEDYFKLKISGDLFFFFFFAVLTGDNASTVDHLFEMKFDLHERIKQKLEPMVLQIP